MIPVSPIVVVLFFAAYAYAGAATGALTGFSTSLILRLGMRGILKDALLGSLGFLLGVIGCALLPWPRNTITYYVDHALVTSTENRYQHPYRVAFVAAALVPLLRELYRSKRSSSD